MQKYRKLCEPKVFLTTGVSETKTLNGKEHEHINQLFFNMCNILFLRPDMDQWYILKSIFYESILCFFL